jgi:hypothetical protein
MLNAVERSGSSGGEIAALSHWSREREDGTLQER